MNLLAEIHWVEAGVCFALGVGVGLFLWRWRERTRQEAAHLERKALREKAECEAESLMREARLAAQEEALRIRRDTEQTYAARQKDLVEAQQRLAQREQLINEQLEGLGERERALREQHQEVQAYRGRLEVRENELGILQTRRLEELQRASHLSASEARTLLLREIEEEIRRDATDLARHVMEGAKSRAEGEAKRILAMCIQRYAGEHTFENATATVALNGDDLKGRIIGREGRNIRAFEAATGVTVLIDDTPNAVVLSGFDPVRREIARQAMERLIQDGRIHPTRIEEVVAKVTLEMEETIIRVGEEAVFKSGLPPLHPELAKLLGRLRFRHSFSQNILDHSVEVAHMAGLLAAEMGLAIPMAKRAGLLHDIGKAVNHEVEGSHALIGADLVQRYGESPEIVNAVASHHDEVPPTGLLGVVVSAADTISASRPGARSESMATYLKRLENLEHLGGGFAGVEKCYAVHAGRELRVLVQPHLVDDQQAYTLARNIARKIENDLQYPGQIRVTVLRETRCVEFAK